MLHAGDHGIKREKKISIHQEEKHKNKMRKRNLYEPTKLFL